MNANTTTDSANAVSGPVVKQLSRTALAILFCSRTIFLICLLGVLVGGVVFLIQMLPNTIWLMLFHRPLYQMSMGQEILPVMDMLDFMMIATVLNKVVIGSYHIFYESLDVEHPYVPQWVKHADAFYVKAQIMLSMAGVSATMMLSDLVQGASSERILDDIKTHFAVLATAAIVMYLPQMIYNRRGTKNASVSQQV